MYKPNLQLHADGGEGSGEGRTGASGVGASYTQAQLDAIVSAREERATRSALSGFFKQQGLTEDEVTKAIEQYNSNKKAASTQKDKEYADALKELRALKNEKAARARGVKEDDLEFVIWKAEKLVDENTNFDKALENFLKENPKYKADGNGAGKGKVTVSTGVKAGGEDKPASKNEMFNAAIRKAAGRE